MNVRTLITCSSLLFATMHGMDQQKPFYVTTNDEKTILVPNYIIPYFKTLKTVQEDLGNEINEIIGAPLRDYSSKKLEFVLELATILHEKKDLNSLMGTILFLNEQEIAEVNKLINYLDATEKVKDAFYQLVQQKFNLNKKPIQNSSTEKIPTSTIDTTKFTINEDVIPYMKTIQNSLDSEPKGNRSKDPIQVVSELLLASTDPAIFNALIEILTVYDQMKVHNKESLFDLNRVLMPIIAVKKKNIAQLLVSILNLINFLEVEVLYNPLLDLIADYLQKNHLDTHDIAWQKLDQDSLYLIKERLITPLMYETQILTIQNPDEKIIISKIELRDISFSKNGLYACGYKNNLDENGIVKTCDLVFIDLNQNKIIYTYPLDFAIDTIHMSNDGSSAFIQKRGIEEANKIYVLDTHNKKLTLTGCKIPNGVTIKAFQPSPDQKKLCIATEQNTLFICGGNNFTEIINHMDLNLERPLGNCSYIISWFPNSLKCAITSASLVNQFARILIIGTTKDLYGKATIFNTINNDNTAVVPLDDKRLFCIQDTKFPYILNFEKAESTEITTSVPLNTHEMQGDPHDGVLSNTQKYILLFSEGSVKIIEAQTGYIIKDFQAIFPAHFNHNDTGLWKHNRDDENNRDNNTIAFYPFRNEQSVMMQDILYNMTLAQLKMITDIFTTMKNKQRIFTGFSSKEKMILQEHQMLQNQEVKLGMTEEDITFLEQFIIQLQDVYTTELFQYELAEETTEDSEDNLDDFMDIDDQ